MKSDNNCSIVPTSMQNQQVFVPFVSCHKERVFLFLSHALRLLLNDVVEFFQVTRFLL